MSRFGFRVQTQIALQHPSHPMYQSASCAHAILISCQYVSLSWSILGTSILGMVDLRYVFRQRRDEKDLSAVADEAGIT